MFADVPNISRNCPVRDLSPRRYSWDNMGMEEMIKTLRRIGLPDKEIERIKTYYRNDLDGLRSYVLYMRALFDDYHEYMA